MEQITYNFSIKAKFLNLQVRQNKIQNIIVIIEINMDINNYGILCPLPQFQAFLKGIQLAKLDGFHSVCADKFKENIDSVTFQQVKSIFLKLHQKVFYKNKKNWKQEEIVLFLYIVDKACLKYSTEFIEFTDDIWNIIAALLPSRTGDSCKTKMISLVPTHLNDIPWTQQQHQVLGEIIQKQGVNKWKTVSLKLYQRNPMKIYRSSKQCRQRYMCFLKPDLKKGFWSDSQDYQLILLYLQYGRKWSKMAQFIQGRNQNAIKNRFFLLFQQSSRNQKLYYSEFMRKVMRRKQKLQKILNIKSLNPVTQKQQQKQNQSAKQCQKCERQTLMVEKKTTNKTNIMEIQHENIQLLKMQSSFETDREYYKCQDIADIEKFFTF